MENTIRVFYVAALKDKATGNTHIDTELVTYRIRKLSSPREGVCWLRKS